MVGMAARLRDYALTADAEFFVGRRAALAEADRLLDPEGDARVMLVHGPGGIGKSAFLRAVVRRARQLGYSSFALDGRAPASAIDTVRSIDWDAVVRPMIVIDEAESLGANAVALREELLDHLPALARLVLAGRVRPDRSWFGGVLDGLTLDLALGPLDEADSRSLLSRRAVGDPERQDLILRWAAGSPLALTVAAASKPGAETPDAVGLADQLIQHLAGTEIDGVDPEVLLVAALAWAVDARLMAAALPDRSARRAMTELSALSVTERLGHRVALHPLLAEAIRTRLRLDDPELARTLLHRIADHLATRALDGDAAALHELTNLIEDPAVRGAVGLGVSSTHIADPVAARTTPPAELAHTEWWATLSPWISAFPKFATGVRRVDGTLVGLAAYLPAALLESAHDDPAVGPVLAYLAAEGIDPAGTLISVAPHAPSGEDPEELAEIVRVANTVLVTRSGMANPRCQVAPFWAGDSTPTAFLTSMGFRVVPQLARTLDARRVDTWVADLGPRGVIGVVAAIVAAEQGLPPSRRDDEERSWLLAALRDFRDENAMAARGPADLDPAAAAEASRERLRAAIDSAFGRSAEDRHLRRVLELGYLTPGLTEPAVLARLHLSRATYYRQLRAARERLAG